MENSQRINSKLKRNTVIKVLLATLDNIDYGVQEAKEGIWHQVSSHPVLYTLFQKLYEKDKKKYCDD